MVDYDVQHLTFPVYLGFADLAWHKTYGIVARSKCYYNYTNQDAPNEYLYRDILSDYGFDTEKSIGNTTVQRNFPIRSTDHHRSHSEDVWA